jgi:hypothetical protein
MIDWTWGFRKLNGGLKTAPDKGLGTLFEAGRCGPWFSGMNASNLVESRPMPDLIRLHQNAAAHGSGKRKIITTRLRDQVSYRISGPIPNEASL